jgi:hypothetical protein
LRSLIRPRRRWGARSARGQGLVEFGLVLPLLLVFLLGVADFGRVFSDGIALEAATRNSAEAATQEYLQLCSKYGGDCGLLTQPDYDGLHDLALDVGCRETERLTNRDEPPYVGDCTASPNLPFWIATCIHDDSLPGDANSCGQDELPTGNVPVGCRAINDLSSWTSVRAGPTEGRPYVEVRMCYHFDPLIPLTETWWGSIWLQRENNFAVTNY